MHPPSNIVRIFCETENDWVMVESDDIPTVCPNDENHTVNTSSGSIYGPILHENKSVKIQEENVNTYGTFERISVKMETDPNSTSVTLFYKEHPITALIMTFTTDSTHEGDVLNLIVGENTPIGVLSQSTLIPSAWSSQNYLKGDKVMYTHPIFGSKVYTCIQDTISNEIPTNTTYWKRGYELKVSKTVLDYSPGMYIKLTDGVNTDDMGSFLDMDVLYRKIYVELPPTHSFISGNVVMAEARKIINYELGKPQTHIMGQGKIGGSYVKENTISRIYYKNNSGVAKKLIGYLEYLR
jgi:hypothetical protein